MVEVLLEHIDKTYPGSELRVVKDFSLTITRGELVCLLGPSGCGKTTTLKIIAGLLEPDRGRVRFDGEDVTRIPAERRESVMVFQNHLLFPFMSVADNVGFGLRMQGVDAREIRRRVTPMLERMQLAGYEERRPMQLSGGQRQRVALARALILEPKVLLLDEPLSNLDASLRDEMRELILSIKEELDVTIIFVTHDLEEAVLLADRIAVMFDGELQQYARSDELYRRPANMRIARFFGNNNAIHARLVDRAVETEAGRLKVEASCTEAVRDGRSEVTLLVRPEEITLHPLPPGGEVRRGEGDNHIPVKILRHVYMGTHRRYIIDVAGHHWAVLDRSRSAPFEVGSDAFAHIPENGCWLLPREPSR
ncbi:MAG: ABC transporter ATP-binding protein [Alkalispirochaetaceae bacterium]